MYIIKSLLVGFYLLNPVLSPLKANIQPTDTVPNYLKETIETIWELSNRNPDSAMLKINKCLELANLSNALKEKAELLRLKGLVKFYKVDYASALEYFVKSRKLNNKIGNKAGEASALSNISLIYQRQGFRKQGLDMEIKALKMRMQIGDSSSIAGSLNNVAVAYKDLGDYRKSLNYYKKAVDICNVIGEISSLDLYY